MTLSNRFALVERERIEGTVTGIDFGSNLQCIARSPSLALFWSGGTMYWSGISTQDYCKSHLIVFYRSCQGQRLDWRNIGEEGGRLTAKRISECAAKIGEAFDDPDIAEQIALAVKERKTLLIEGGGQEFRAKR